MSAPATQPATTSATPWTLVRLRWALTNAALKTSPWQIVAYVLAYLLAAGTVVGTGVLAFAVGHGMAHDVWPYLPVIMPLAGTAGILFVALLQAMFIGENSTMSMDKFAPYGIPDRTLQLGLLLAGLTGIPAITALVSFMLWAMAYRGFGAAAVASQLVAAPLIVLTAMCVSKALLAVADIITDSQAGKNIFYVVVIMLFVALAQMPNILMINEVSVEAASLIPVARVFGWLPLGAPFMLPFDAANGQWLFWVLHVLCALALCAVCFLVSQWCLHWQRTHSSDAVRAKAAKGLGLFSRMPDSPSGAISARLGSLLRRDARQSMMYIMPLFFVVIFALENKDIGPWFVDGRAARRHVHVAHRIERPGIRRPGVRHGGHRRHARNRRPHGACAHLPDHRHGVHRAAFRDHLHHHGRLVEPKRTGGRLHVHRRQLGLGRGVARRGRDVQLLGPLPGAVDGQAVHQSAGAAPRRRSCRSCTCSRRSRASCPRPSSRSSSSRPAMARPTRGSSPWRSPMA